MAKDIQGQVGLMRDRHGNLFRWEIKWQPYFRPFFERDCFLDGGTKFWHIGFVTIYRWYVPE